MFRPPSLSPEVEAYLLMHPDVDANIIAHDIGISVLHVRSHQRWLGIRKLAENNPKVRRTCR
jgi:hypothetical protein